MKDVRFYLEYKNKTEKNKGTRKKPGKHKGTVVAVFYENSWLSSCQTESGLKHQLIYDAIGGLFAHENSVSCGTSVSQSYLSSLCKHISEKLAREIHPALFEYLDSVD